MSQSPSASPRAGDDQDSPVPQVRPLGVLAVGCGVLSIVLAPTFFLSLLALPLGALAVGLGLAARTEDSIRTMGTVAAVLGSLALVGATTLLALVLMAGA